MRRFFIPRLTIFSLILLNFMLIRFILKSKRKIKTKGHMLPVDSYVHKLDIQVEKENQDEKVLYQRFFWTLKMEYHHCTR